MLRHKQGQDAKKKKKKTLSVKYFVYKSTY